MEELEKFLQNPGPYEPQIVLLLAACFVLLVIRGHKKKTQETPVQLRFVKLQERLIKALELEETSFLTEATAIHQEYKALSEAYQKLYGSDEEQKK
jgi:hypothetical protein